MADDELLVSLLERWEDAHEQGTLLTPEELCRDHPHLLAELTRRVGQLLALAKVLDFQPTIDHSTPVEEGTPEVPGYEIVRLLGVGGMGMVYEARHKILGTTRVVKVMRSSRVTADALERFRREMTVGARFEHDHIVPVHEAGLLADGNPYFVMPLVRGGSLKDHLPRYRADLRAGVALLAKVCRAVGYAHSRGIVHRDLKPGNIVLTEEGKPLVADFGIAKLLSQETETPADPPQLAAADRDTPADPPTATRITHTGAIIGTWAYLSPEAVRGQIARVDARSDIWALGVVLYELLAGAYPFPAKEPVDVAAQITTTEPPLPGPDPTLARIVMRCLRKEQAERYPTAEALADDLEAWAAGRPPAGVTPTWGYRLRRQARRGWKVAAGVAALLSLALVLLATFSGAPSSHEKYLEAVGPALARLRRGERVSLIGPGVDPAYVLTFGNGRTRKADGGPDGAIAFASDGPARWEFLPEVPTPKGAYRVEAEIVQTMAYPGDNQCGGIALAGTDFATTSGAQHVFLFCGLAEAGTLAGQFTRAEQGNGGGAFLWMLLLGEDLRHPFRWSPGVPWDKWGEYIPPAQDGSPPRALRVDVRPAGLSARVSDRPAPFAVVDRAELRKEGGWWQARSWNRLPDLKGQVFRFPVDGSLGIVTRDSEVIVTRLEVIPLDE
jgi:tRNA A-37 threonylcarbamoyl transferase component Bud32